MVESVIIVVDESPIGKNSAIEAIRLGSGFMGLGEEIDCKIIFTGDAIYAMNKHADPTLLGIDSFEEPLEMAELSDLEIRILDQALEEAGLTSEDLVEYENLNIITFDEMIDLITEADTTFRF